MTACGGGGRQERPGVTRIADSGLPNRAPGRPPSWGPRPGPRVARRVRVARLGEIARCLDDWCPPSWAEEWDQVGLLLGDPASDVRRCLCALDADERTVARAAEAGAQLLVTHHPLPFRPVRRLVADAGPTPRALLLAARSGVALYAAHTNLDVHPDGVNAALAAALGLRGAEPLRVTGRETLYKLVAFVPVGHEEHILQALAEAGAGQLGRYSHCSFAARGQGTFLPLPGARPFVGRVGALHRQEESRLEVLLPASRRDAAIAALLRAHPYEQPAYDVLRLENEGPPRALGRIGELRRPLRLDGFARAVAARLRAPATRYAGDPARRVHRVAVCGGAGAALAAEARRAGAEVLVTADVRYHQACEAEADGLAVIDPGHRATEAPVVPVLAEAVRRLALEAGLPIEVEAVDVQGDLWRAVSGATRGRAGRVPTLPGRPGGRSASR